MAAESTSPTLCFTVYSYKKEGLSDEEYREYMIKKHAPLASTLMEKYGILGFNMVRRRTHNFPTAVSSGCVLLSKRV